MKRMALLSAIFSIGVVACGGGGGETTAPSSPSDGIGGGPGGGGGTTPTATYLAYQGSVYIVDPANPSSPIQIPTNPILDSEVLLGVSIYDSSTKTFSDLHRHSIYWIEEQDGIIDPANPTTKNGGPLYMLSMVKGSSTPTPKRLSNITDACEIFYSEDDIYSKKKYMVVMTAGANGQCGDPDDGKVLIHSGMSSSDNPIDMSNRDIISPIHGGLSNPQWTGFLIFESGAIKKCDLNLSTCTTVSPGPFNNVDHFATNPSNGNIYICADGNLHKFDGTNLSQIPGVNCALSWDTTADSNAIYAVDDTSGNVLKLTYGGTGWQTIYSGGDATSISTSTQNYLIVMLNTEGLIAVPKNGGTTTSLTSSGAKADFAWNVGNKVYFTEIVIDPSTNLITSIKACEWTEGSSSANCNDNSYFAGVSLATDGTVDTSGGFPIPVYRLLRVDGVDLSQGYPSGGTLKAINPSNGSTTDLGTVPPGFFVGGFGIGDHMLLTGVDFANSKQTDVFYVNLSQPNSLQRLTNTVNSNESALF